MGLNSRKVVSVTAPRDGPVTIALGDILTGLSHALDITEGHERGHTTRACLIGMRLARLVGLSDTERLDLFYALLMKDAGGSSSATYLHQLFGTSDLQGQPTGLGLRDWRSLSREAGYSREYADVGGSIWDRIAHLGHLAKAGRAGRRSLFRIRSTRGARIALGLGLSEATAAAIRAMDEHWDGGGDPLGLRGAQIPILARIIGLAQVAEVFSHEHGEALALEVVERRGDRWFDPDLVAAFRALSADTAFWQSLKQDSVDDLVKTVEPDHVRLVADDARLDQIAEAFAALVDAKSPFTSDHSRRVAHVSVRIGERLGFSASTLTRLRRAALLHDIGKLGVPSVVLEKNGPLSSAEWALVRNHPAHTLQILQCVPGFRDFAMDAACHHEKLDGSGYHLGYTGGQLSQTARALSVADMADALLSDRPYRKGLDPMEMLRILHGDCAAGKLCPDSVAALTDFVQDTLAQHARVEPKVDAPVEEDGWSGPSPVPT